MDKIQVEITEEDIIDNDDIKNIIRDMDTMESISDYYPFKYSYINKRNTFEPTYIKLLTRVIVNMDVQDKTEIYILTMKYIDVINKLEQYSKDSINHIDTIDELTKIIENKRELIELRLDIIDRLEEMTTKYVIMELYEYLNERDAYMYIESALMTMKKDKVEINEIYIILELLGNTGFLNLFIMMLDNEDEVSKIRSIMAIIKASREYYNKKFVFKDYYTVSDEVLEQVEINNQVISYIDKVDMKKDIEELDKHEILLALNSKYKKIIYDRYKEYIIYDSDYEYTDEE